MHSHAQTKGQIKTLCAILANIAVFSDIVNTNLEVAIVLVMELISVEVEFVRLSVDIQWNSAVAYDKSK